METENNSTPSAETPCSRFVLDILSDWYECAPYGEQIPKDLPKLFAEFCQRHGGKDEDGMWEAFTEAEPDDPILKLFECIWRDGAEFAVGRIADAVFDRNEAVLKLVDLRLIGTMATRENDPNPACAHQHVLHPNQGGEPIFGTANNKLSHRTEGVERKSTA